MEINNPARVNFWTFSISEPRLHLVNKTHFSNFCERSELDKTEFKLGRSWGFSYKALLRDWAGIPSCLVYNPPKTPLPTSYTPPTTPNNIPLSTKKPLQSTQDPLPTPYQPPTKQPTYLHQETSTAPQNYLYLPLNDNPHPSTLPPSTFLSNPTPITSNTNLPPPPSLPTPILHPYS